ncbi:hypothetical protein [Planomicrobium okeanokoites]|uniref:hypothetical protein n=1 Tax=Planomicrobium okeanokoites TaxID=244 RepID=UPI0030FB6A6C
MVKVAVELKDFSITENLLKENINYAWEEKYQSYGYSDTEKTSLILNNLYDVIINDPVLLKTTYKTLVSLNSNNRENQLRLNLKLRELLSDLK